MADITNQTIVHFDNEKGRVLADTAGQLYQTSKRMQQEWVALLSAVGSVPNTADQIADGSQSSASVSDGRKPMTGAQLNNLKALADAMVTWFETGSPTRISQLQLLTTNEQSRF